MRSPREGRSRAREKRSEDWALVVSTFRGLKEGEETEGR